jgi:hypothetical protein
MKRKTLISEEDNDFEDTQTKNNRIMKDKQSKLSPISAPKPPPKTPSPTNKPLTEPVSTPDKSPKKKKMESDVKVSQPNTLVDTTRQSVAKIESKIAEIESKIIHRTPLLSSQIRALEDLRTELDDILLDIVVAVVSDCSQSFGYENPNFDIHAEDLRWNTCKNLVSKIDSIFDSHENTNPTEIKILSEILKRKEERKKRNRLVIEQMDREWHDIASRSESAQIKFFVSRDGPLKGRNIYTEWKSVEKMKASVGL